MNLSDFLSRKTTLDNGMASISAMNCTVVNTLTFWESKLLAFVETVEVGAITEKLDAAVDVEVVVAFIIVQFLLCATLPKVYLFIRKESNFPHESSYYVRCIRIA